MTKPEEKKGRTLNKSFMLQSIMALFFSAIMIFGTTSTILPSHQQEAYAQTPIDIRYDVQLVPQETDVSCWGAAAAMIVGWRDGISISSANIADSLGYGIEFAGCPGGLPLDDTKMMEQWGLVAEAPQTLTPEGFAQLLEQYGPLYVVTAEPGTHARVVTGMSGDGTADGTTLFINDPWEPNVGSQYTETYNEFLNKQATLAGETADMPGVVYVAHLP